jgi:DNA polymerase epsilon subunit 1
MTIHSIEIVYKQDLDELNHLSPIHSGGKPMLQLNFDTTAQLIQVRDSLRHIITKNLQRRHPNHTTTDVWSSSTVHGNAPMVTSITSKSIYDDEPLRYLTDLREYDVPYIVRVCTDMDIRAGTWYTVQIFDPNTDHSMLMVETDIDHSHRNSVVPTISHNPSGGIRLIDPDRESKANPVVLAFDIECTKAPLKFPSAEVDEIFMISYMVSSPITGQAQGYLIVSRSVVSSDVQNFDYTPKPNYPGPFHIFNESNEKDLLQRFFSEFRKHAPQIVVTYNGDFFDFPYVDARAKLYGMNLYREIGIEMVGGNSNTTEGGTSGSNNNTAGTYRGRLTVHLDAFHWVQRDSYLPQGAQGLKAVTKYKLGYDPVEVDPEDMVRFAQEQPIHMATYSVSDAVATFYLYEMYVHLFIFSLCTIIPMGPEDVLGKGSGTLCEALLMVEACKKNILCPNKHTDDMTKFHNGHLLESETYIGGKVECLETGVYRSDLQYDFQLQPTAFQQLIDNVDRDLTFTIEVENCKQKADVTNYDEVR